MGAGQAFTGAWRLGCGPDLPYVATYGHYNGTPISACAEVADAGVEAGGDAGRRDAGADGGAAPEGADARSARRRDAPPESGCGVAPARRGSALLLAPLALLAAVARRRRSKRR